jgi:hypothetical protein
MQSVYGVVPSELISQGPILVEFPAFLGRTVGACLPIDCNVGVLQLDPASLISNKWWAWKPVERGYVISVNPVPFSVLKNHLRCLRQFQDEVGCNRVWPWFDPRYLKLALNTLESSDLSKLFGPIQSFGFAVGEQIEQYVMQGGQLQIRQVPA